MTTNARGDHWPRHAEQWARVGPPLRPAAEDIASVSARVTTRGPVRALVLGVTPELVGLPWPTGSAITAVDRSAAMIAAHRPPHTTCVRADWRALPCAAATADVVVGDGALSVLASADYGQVARELARVLAPGGELVLRLFTAPDVRKTVAALAAAPSPGSFHAFKWRLAMALAAGGDVAVAAIARAFDELAPDRAALAAATGWSPAAIATIDAYRGSELVYSFPPRATVLAALAPHFELAAAHVPGYELGERCPTVVLRLVS